MTPRILHRHVFVIALSLIVFVGVGLVANHFIIRAVAGRPDRLPPIFVAKTLDRINARDRLAAFSEIQNWPDPMIAMSHLFIVTETGEVRAPQGGSLRLKWTQLTKPQSEYDSETFGLDLVEGLGASQSLLASEREGVLVRLKGEPSEYLVLIPRMDRVMGPMGPPPPGEPLGGWGAMPHPMPPPPGVPWESRRPGGPGGGAERTGPPVWIPILSSLFLLISLVLGVSVAVAYIHRSVQRYVDLADGVLTELQKGNLKARFPILRNDEFGQAMARFNLMAAEIEKLVQKMHDIESSRTKMLQELTHDLRTPIASMKSLLETLETKKSKLTIQMEQELTSLLQSEVSYFERLVEDLLFLSRVEEPQYQVLQKEFDLVALLKDEVERGQVLARETRQPMSFRIEYSGLDKCLYSGDPRLMRRMIRNLLDNALSFGRSEILVSCNLLTESDQIEIIVQDDGPGMSDELLLAYGVRRFSRQLHEGHSGGRVSIGLGSVVVKKVVERHHGDLMVQNRIGTDGQRSGALVRVQLPLGQVSLLS